MNPETPAETAQVPDELKADVERANIRLDMERRDNPKFIPTYSFLQRSMRWGFSRAALVFPYLKGSDPTPPPVAEEGKPTHIDVWEVEPHIDGQYDAWVIPVADDPEGRKALEYAKDSLENLWDTAESLEGLNVSVRLRRRTMNPEDIDDGK